MGKIRVAALGSEVEQELKEKQRVRRQEKKKREVTEKVHISGMKGGERIKSVGAGEEDVDKMVKLAKQMESQEQPGRQTATSASAPMDIGATADKAGKKEKFRKSGRAKKYQELRLKVDPTKQYAAADALVLLREVSFAKFDSTVELHINTLEKGQRGTVQLPHGTGKEVRVAIAEPATIDKLIENVEKGIIEFDALVAHPSVMPLLAKVAKFLGPKGLMPNPKNGTISPTPDKVADKLKGGEVNWKTESEFPIIHQIVGKLSFKDKQLEENISVFIASVGATKIKNVTLKSTMSPGIKLQISA